jgi:hypothetical protein
LIEEFLFAAAAADIMNHSTGATSANDLDTT